MNRQFTLNLALKERQIFTTRIAGADPVVPEVKTKPAATSQ
jgi:hypothetical protein